MSRRVWHVEAWTIGHHWEGEVAAKSRGSAIASGIARSGLTGRVLHAAASRVKAKSERQWTRRYWRIIRAIRVVRRAGVEVDVERAQQATSRAVAW